MKKHLLSTSAIALGVAAAAPAAAQEWDVSFGGFMSQHVAYADISGTANAGQDLDGVDIHSNSEIIFSPSITLDNGLTFGVNIQLEGENGGSEIDESYMSISSDTLGQILIGSENSAGYKSMVGAPGVVSMYINSPSISTFIPFSNAYGGGFRQAGLSSFTEVAGNNDVSRITYFTPSFNGLTVGVSYAPTGSVNVGNSFGVDKNTVLSDIFDIGVNYSQTFGTTSVTLAARYGTGDSQFVGQSDPETWGVGAQVGFADFTIGGSYTENDNGAPGGVSTNVAAVPNTPGVLGVAGVTNDYGSDSNGYSLGATYDMAGPWAFEAQAYIGEVEAGASDQSYEAYQIGASRDMGPGVSWDVYVTQVNSDDGAGNSSDGTIIGTGINLSF